MTSLLPADLRHEAIALARDLADAAGNEPAVLDALRTHDNAQQPGNLLRVAAAALVVVFSECITPTTSPGATAPVIHPSDLTKETR